MARPLPGFNTPNPPDEPTTNYIVVALARFEERLKALEDAAKERAAASDKRHDDFLAAAQQRGKLYDHRDAEWTKQIESIAEQVRNLGKLYGTLASLDEDVKDMASEVHELHQEHKAIEQRLNQVEECKRRVEEHFRDTAPDHAILSTTRSRFKAIGWLAAALMFVATSTSGVIPLIEKLWPTK